MRREPEPFVMETEAVEPLPDRTRPCGCTGTRHVVCLPLKAWRAATREPKPLGFLTLREALAQGLVIRSSTAPVAVEATVTPCDCAGARHLVCLPDAAWSTMRKRFETIRFLSLSEALAEGVVIRPHHEHVVWICDPLDPDELLPMDYWKRPPAQRSRVHHHTCLCGNGGRDCAGAQDGTQKRLAIPVNGYNTNRVAA